VGGLHDAVVVADLLPMVSFEQIHDVVEAHDRPRRHAGGPQSRLAGLLILLDADTQAIVLLPLRDAVENLIVIEVLEAVRTDAETSEETRPEPVGRLVLLVLHDHARHGLATGLRVCLLFHDDVIDRRDPVVERVAFGERSSHRSETSEKGCEKCGGLPPSSIL